MCKHSFYEGGEGKLVETRSTAVLATCSSRKCFCTKCENIQASILGLCTSADSTQSIRGHASLGFKSGAAWAAPATPLPTALVLIVTSRSMKQDVRRYIEMDVLL